MQDIEPLAVRAATPGDLDFILELEDRPEFGDLIYRWSEAEHRAALDDPDYRYLIATVADERLGFAILRGLASPLRSVELKRIAVAEPGRGVGREMLCAVVSRMFEDEGAHRLWLEVFTDNLRAQSAYRAVGFVEEGVLRDAGLRSDGFGSFVVMSILEDEYRQRA